MLFNEEKDFIDIGLGREGKGMVQGNDFFTVF